MKQEPHYFTLQDFLKAIFGAFLIGLNFIFKGSMFDYASKMTTANSILLIAITCAIVSIEIYIFSYRFVVDRKKRPFYEFWTKRFFTITTATFAILYLTIYLYGINNYITRIEMFKFASAVFLPAAIFGSALEILKKR